MHYVLPISHILLSLRVALTAGALAIFAGNAMAADPKAIQTEFDVEVYSQNGVTIGCGLSFLAAWVDSDKFVLAAAGTINYFVPDRTNIGSTLKVRATLNNQTRGLSFAWVEAADVGTTKAFTPLTPTQTGPSFSFSGKPDRQGLARLRSAAKSGFVLGLSIVGMPLDETALLPAAPTNVLARLDTCTKELASRQAELEAR